jgi:hypothetical protein
MSELLWKNLEDRISTMEFRFNLLLREAAFPVVSENSKELIKYYYNNHHRARARNMKQSLVVHSTYMGKTVRSVVQT